MTGRIVGQESAIAFEIQTPDNTSRLLTWRAAYFLLRQVLLPPDGHMFRGSVTCRIEGASGHKSAIIKGN